jgi:hypothetical protein
LKLNIHLGFIIYRTLQDEEPQCVSLVDKLALMHELHEGCSGSHSEYFEVRWAPPQGIEHTSLPVLRDARHQDYFDERVKGDFPDGPGDLGRFDVCQEGLRFAISRYSAVALALGTGVGRYFRCACAACSTAR